MTPIDNANIITSLTGYFTFPYNLPVSYYNAFSCINLVDKLKRRYAIKDPEPEFSYNEEHLVLRIGGHLGVVVAPKTLNYLDNTCARLKESCATVLVHVPNEKINNIKYRIFKTYSQVLYDCHLITTRVEKDVAENTRLILNARSRSSFKKNQRECRFTKGNAQALGDCERVLTIWESTAAGKGENTSAINKDRNAFEWSVHTDKVFSYAGYRGPLPVSYSFMTKLPGHPEVATLLAAKSLNYQHQPGGYNETSVWEIYSVCSELLNRGVFYLNSSGAENQLNLSSFKERFITNTQHIEAYDYEYCS